MIRKSRVISQGLFLLFFLWLFIQSEAKGLNEIGYPVKIFLDADPLVFIATLLSSHAWYKTLYLAILVMILTVFLGRVFCGWICPLGTLNNIASARKGKRPDKLTGKNYNYFKYLILLFLLTSSLFSLQLTGIFDPISLLIRSLSLAVYPLLSYAIRATFDVLYNVHIPFVANSSEFIYTLLKKALLPFQQPFFLQSTFVGVLFVFIIGANLMERRFWCKYLCPLGALLGLLSKYALLGRSVSEGCNACGACTHVCSGNAAPEQKENWKKTECLACMNCDDICPQNAVHFGFFGKHHAAAMDLGKRRVIGSLLMGLIAAPLVKLTPAARTGASDPRLLRPPGSLDEHQFLARCTKCGECMKVCITNGIQPAFLEAGIEGIWSPMLVPRIGYCDYRCTLCGQVCPTGAIRQLSISEKAAVKIGLAMIDRGRCLPHAHATPCIVCEEVCPTPKKAIWLQKVAVKNREGRELILSQPHVDLELCVGCGICEAKCPILGKPAIYVISVGESRSRDNQLLLS